MFKRDDYIRNNHDAVFSNWQGFARSMLLRKPFSETAELRRTLVDYSSISRDLGHPKVLMGAIDREENFRKSKNSVGSFRIQGLPSTSFPGLSELGAPVISHEQAQKVVDPNEILVNRLAQGESIRSQLQRYGRSGPYMRNVNLTSDNKAAGPFDPKDCETNEFPVKKASDQKKIGDTIKDKRHVLAEDMEISCDTAKEKSNFLESVLKLSHSERHDGSDSSSVCGFLREDGTTCTTTPVKGRKRCTEHKGQRIYGFIREKHIPYDNIPTLRKQCKDTDNICGVILPYMEPCRRTPVHGRKRCEEHKGMRINAFSFLINLIKDDKTVKEDAKSEPETRTDIKQEGPGHVCEAITMKGLPCTRNAPKGSRRCWQHKEKPMEDRSAQNVQSATTICGVKLYNGSVCEKSPVKGRKRCEEHKGMRITS